MKQSISGIGLIATMLGFSVLSLTVQAETVFVTLEKDNALAVVDPIEGKLLKTVDIGQRPRGIILSPDNKYLIVWDNAIKPEIFLLPSFQKMYAFDEKPAKILFSPDSKQLAFIQNDVVDFVEIDIDIET